MAFRFPILALLLATAAPTRAAPLPTVTKQVLKQTDPRGKWAFSYQYPKLSVPGALMGVNGICQNFNQRMQQQAEQSLQAFKQAVTENAALPAAVKAKSERTVTYQLVTRKPGLVAVRFSEFQYLRGQAHPTTTLSTANFSLQDEFLKLEPLFQPNSGYLEKLSAAVGKQLQAEAAKKQFEIIAPEGYAARAGNFQDFLVTAQGLTFLFNPAEVAPYAAGPLSAAVPWSALEASLSDQGRRVRQAVR
jgi:hypothetical protein